MSRNMSSTTGTRDIQCPYFVAHSKTEIKCQGDLPDAGTIHRFKTERDKTIQQEVFCEKYFRKCPHFINIERWGWDN